MSATCFPRPSHHPRRGGKAPLRKEERMPSRARRNRAARRAAALALAMPTAMMPGADPAWAAAIWLYEMATPDQGTAAAGRAALAVDASTAWLNPAGMTRLDRSQLLIGAGALVIQSEFDIAPGTTESGGGANITSAPPSASGYYVQSFLSAPDLKLRASLPHFPG